MSLHGRLPPQGFLLCRVLVVYVSPTCETSPVRRRRGSLVSPHSPRRRPSSAFVVPLRPYGSVPRDLPNGTPDCDTRDTKSVQWVRRLVFYLTSLFGPTSIPPDSSPVHKGPDPRTSSVPPDSVPHRTLPDVLCRYSRRRSSSHDPPSSRHSGQTPDPLNHLQPR